MNLETWIGAVMMCMAVLGGAVSAHGPSKMLPKIAYILTFVILGVIGFLLILRSSKENALAKHSADLKMTRIEKTVLDLKASSNIKDSHHPLATSADLAGRYIRNLSFRMVDLVTEVPIVKGKVFEDCDIYGPAVLILRKNTLNECGFTGNPDMIFITTSQVDVMGVVLVEDCVFNRCNFGNVAFIGSPQEKQWFLNQVSKKSE